MDRRALPIVASAAVVVAAVGFLTGTRPPARGAGPGPVTAAAAASTPVPRYADMGNARRGPLATMYAGALGALQAGVAALPPATRATPEERAAAVDARAARRAFDGAPPVIPHAVDAVRQDCRSCHANGAVVDGKVARAMSHAPYEMCQQCHVPVADPRGVGEAPPPPESLFVGRASSGNGVRVWAGAPPTMPHGTWMRESCASCHGPAGQPGLRTSHPDRQSCNQCHAPASSLEARFPRIGGIL